MRDKGLDELRKLCPKNGDAEYIEGSPCYVMVKTGFECPKEIKPSQPITKMTLEVLTEGSAGTDKLQIRLDIFIKELGLTSLEGNAHRVHLDIEYGIPEEQTGVLAIFNRTSATPLLTTSLIGGCYPVEWGGVNKLASRTLTY